MKAHQNNIEIAIEVIGACIRNSTAHGKSTCHQSRVIHSTTVAIF